MVDETEFGDIDADERTDTQVITKQNHLDGLWYICHARSHQNAFKRSVNGFRVRADAVEFAEAISG